MGVRPSPHGGRAYPIFVFGEDEEDEDRMSEEGSSSDHAESSSEDYDSEDDNGVSLPRQKSSALSLFFSFFMSGCRKLVGGGGWGGVVTGIGVGICIHL